MNADTFARSVLHRVNLPASEEDALAEFDVERAYAIASILVEVMAADDPHGAPFVEILQILEGC